MRHSFFAISFHLVLPGSGTSCISVFLLGFAVVMRKSFFVPMVLTRICTTSKILYFRNRGNVLSRDEDSLLQKLHCFLLCALCIYQQMRLGYRTWSQNANKTKRRC